MATYRKRNGKWQAIVRHKTIGTTSRSFHTKQAAIKWVISVEEQLEAGPFGTLRPTHITLGELLERYSVEVTPAKRGATTELRRLQRLIRDPFSSLKVSQLTSQAIAAFRDRRLLDGRRTCHYDLIYLYDQYINPYVARWLEDNTRAFDDAYALTELIQWVWRSRVRNGQPITLYLASPRMRQLMEKWLSDQALLALELKGKHMKTFALILFFSCAGLLIISATVQILYAVL